MIGQTVTIGKKEKKKKSEEREREYRILVRSSII